MRAPLRLLAVPSVFGSALLAGCGYQPGYGNRPMNEAYSAGLYEARHVADLPGSGEVRREHGRLVFVDRYGRRGVLGPGPGQVCHQGKTQNVADAFVQLHLDHGDRFGTCPVEVRSGIFYSVQEAGVQDYMGTTYGGGPEEGLGGRGRTRLVSPTREHPGKSKPAKTGGN